MVDAEDGPDDSDPTPAIRRVGDGDDDREQEGNVAGMLPRDQPLEPQDIDLENAVFVALGALLVVVFLVLSIGGL